MNDTSSRIERLAAAYKRQVQITTSISASMEASGVKLAQIAASLENARR